MRGTRRHLILGLVVLSMVIFSNCNGNSYFAGFRGRAFERKADGSIGDIAPQEPI
ncbi:MAG: hypothetical protein PVI78_04870 [Anaerolineales bacterium]|jgi:hypothetical protein